MTCAVLLEFVGLSRQAGRLVRKQRGRAWLVYGFHGRNSPELYGLNRKESAPFGRQCLIARRLVERGIRFVQIFFSASRISGGAVSDVPWDGHSDINVNHRDCAASVDQPAAALLVDLKARGLLDSTLVIW